MKSFIEDVKSFRWISGPFQIRQDTDLGHMVRRVEENIALDIPSGLSDNELTALVVDKLDKFLTETESGQRELVHMQDYGLTVATSFQNAFETLKGQVADEIHHLSEKVFSYADNLVSKRLGFTQLDGELMPTHGTYVLFKCDELASEIEHELKAFTDKYELRLDRINIMNIKFMIDKMVVTEFPTLSEESVKRITNSFMEKLPQNTIQEHLDIYKRMISGLMSESVFSELKRSLFSRGIYSGQLNEESILSALGFVKMFPTFFKIAKSMNFEVLDEAQVQMEYILNKMQDMFLICVCVLELTRNKYQDKLIIGKNLLNAEELEKFQQNGGTLEDITTHIRLHYNSNEKDILYDKTAHGAILSGGISTKDLLIALPEDRQKLDKYKNEVKLKLMVVKQTCTHEALSVTLKDYIRDKMTSVGELPDNCDAKKFEAIAMANAKAACTSLIGNSQSNVEDALYVFYLNTWFKESLVSTIYYKMGAEVVATLTANETTTDDIMSQIQATVMADIIGSYIAKVFVEKVK